MGTIVLALAGLVALLVLVSRPLGFQLYAIQGGSMGQALPVGSVAMAQPVDPTTLAPGDIVAFESPLGRVITHRVVEVEEEGFRTRGDANEEADASLVPASRVVGKVRLAIPFLGYFAHSVRTPLGYVFFQLLPGMAIITLELRRLTRLRPSKEPALVGGWGLIRGRAPSWLRDGPPPRGGRQ